jgi:hypothetical protein
VVLGLQPLDITIVHDVDSTSLDSPQLGAGQLLRENQPLHTRDQNYFLMVRKEDGNLVLSKGLGPSDPQATLVWQSGATYVDPDPAKQEFYLSTTDDGRLVVMKGTSPSNNRGQLWSTAATGPSGGLYYLEIEDAGRIVVRRSNGDMVWTSSLFTNWNSGEPNNSGGLEHCAVAYRSMDGKSNDVPCTLDNIHYACRSIYDPMSWRITTAQGVFSSGHRACYQEFGVNYAFAAPRGAQEQSAFAAQLHSPVAAEVWINLSDDGHEGQWRETGPQDFWLPYEPNNAGSGEHCAMSTSTGWMDVPCDDSFPFLCKGPGSTPNWAVTWGRGSAVNGDGGQCAAQYGSGYRFAAPMSASEQEVVQSLLQNGGQAFINLTDAGHEGIWTYP